MEPGGDLRDVALTPSLVFDALKRGRLLVAAVVVGATVFGILSAYDVGLSPPSIHAKSLPRGVATGQVLITSKTSSIARADADIVTQSRRTVAIEELMQSDTIRRQIARAIKTDINAITVTTLSDLPAPRSFSDPFAGLREQRIASGTPKYDLQIKGRQDFPVLELYGRAPDAAHARRLLSASITALSDFLSKEASSEQVPTPARLQVHRLGQLDAQGVNRNAPVAVAIAAALIVLTLGLVLVVFLARNTQLLRQSRAPA